MAKYLLINKATNIVENIVEVVDESWQAPDSVLSIPHEQAIGQVWVFNSQLNDFVTSDVAGCCAIGDTYNGSKCITHLEKPAVVEPTPTPSLTKEELLAQLQALQSQIQALE